jgi:hypothetical protein
MRLRPNEVCPIHRSVSCCGRDRIAKPRLIRPGVQRVEDPHHPRGYRSIEVTGRNAEATEPKNPRTRWHLHDLP